MVGDDGSLVIQANITELNALLERATYNPAANWNNVATAGEVEEVSITLSSVTGESGESGESVTVVVDVDVASVNDGPTWVLPADSSLPLKGQEGMSLG